MCGEEPDEEPKQQTVYVVLMSGRVFDGVFSSEPLAKSRADYLNKCDYQNYAEVESQSVNDPDPWP